MTDHKIVFVTVGTTDFDELIENIDTEEFIECLKLCGFTKLIIQLGRGRYVPGILKNYTTCNNSGSKRGLSVDIYDFKSNLKEDMTNASLIISHCGAGSILESITLRKPLIVVINSSLQDNHQKELSDALTEGKYCLSASPKSLVSVIFESHRDPLNDGVTKSFPINDDSLMPSILSSLFDFQV